MTGITMSQYRTNLKLHDVLARLVDGDTNLSDIAVSAGFIDHSHMTRTFVANVGATPSELRQVLPRRPGGATSPDPAGLGSAAVRDRPAAVLPRLALIRRTPPPHRVHVTVHDVAASCTVT